MSFELVPTADGSLTLRNAEHAECYHSLRGAMFEAEELYVKGSHIAERFASGRPTRVFDIGLGLGYNVMATFAAWEATADSGPLYVDSFEIDDSLIVAFAAGKAPWMQNWASSWVSWCQTLRPAAGGWRGCFKHPTSGAEAIWQVYVGDAQEVSSERLKGAASVGCQFIWQDPFSTTKNPPLWSASWFEKLRLLSESDVVLLTYSVARLVKNSLTESGWQYELLRTPGSKRAWLRASLIPAKITLG